MNLKEELHPCLSTLIKCIALYPIVWVLYLVTLYNALYITVNSVSNKTLKSIINNIYGSNISIVIDIGIVFSIIYLFFCIKLDFLNRKPRNIVSLLCMTTLILSIVFITVYALIKIHKIKPISLFCSYLILMFSLYITFLTLDSLTDKYNNKIKILREYTYFDYINQNNFNNKDSDLIKAFKFFWGVSLLIMIFIYPVRVVVNTKNGLNVDLITSDNLCCKFTLIQTFIITYFLYKICAANMTGKSSNEKWIVLSKIFSKGIIIPIITLVVNLITNYLKR